MEDGGLISDIRPPTAMLIAYNFFPKLIKAFYTKHLPEHIFQPFTRIYTLDLFR